MFVHTNTVMLYTYHLYILLKRRSTVRSRDHCLYYVWLGTCWWIQIKNVTKQNYALSVNFCWRVLINKPSAVEEAGEPWDYEVSDLPWSVLSPCQGDKRKHGPRRSKVQICQKSYIFVVNPLEDFNEQLQLQLGQACHSCSFSRDISFFFRTPSAVILFMAACSKAFDGCERCRPWPRAAQLCS